MKSKEFIIEGDDKNINDVQVNHPEIYKFLVNQVGSMALEKQATVEAVDSASSHIVVIKIKPGAGMRNVTVGLENAGIPFESFASGGIAGETTEFKFQVADDNVRGNRTETWRFFLPLA